jgi:stage III sporulation protein AB
MMATNHRREVLALRQLVLVLEKMICELEYRLTPLPELCRFGAEQTNGAVQTFFRELACIMDEQISPDVGICTVAALKRTSNLPVQTAAQLQALGQTLGRFDLQGQLNSLEQCKQSCLGQLEVLEYQQPQRLRSYQTLGFCAGAALAILLY